MTGTQSRKVLRQRLEKQVAGTIQRARRHTTILFTDVEDSTRYWDNQGDVRGRLAVDLHNRLVFPVVKRYGGKVIKTIGDSVMATFRKPSDGVHAAIGIQQALAAERARNPDFHLKVRIGLHAGEALVEKGDVYGNAVNTAARVESCAEGDQILISGTTFKQLGKGAQQRYAIERGERITPRGQKRAMTLYQVGWTQLEENLAGDIDPDQWMTPRDKGRLLLYALGTLAGLGWLFFDLGRYLLLDWDLAATLVLNPQQILTHPWVVAALALAVLALVMTLVRLQRRPVGTLRALRGSFSFSLAVVIAQLAIAFWPTAWTPTHHWQQPLYESDHLFVEVQAPRAWIYREPKESAEPLREVRAGTLLLLADVRHSDALTWNRVLIDAQQYGWIVRVLPARIGVPETRVSLTDKFYLRWTDFYALAAGLVGLLWGLIGFRLRPL